MESEPLATKLERCVETAVEAGCPRNQVERFLNTGYIPLRWQWDFHAAAREADIRCDLHLADPTLRYEGTCGCGPVDIGCGGARGPGKSHAVLSQAALDDCQRVDGLKGLFLRQTGVSARESFDDLVNKVVVGHVKMERTMNTLKFPNKSHILLGGFRTEGDIDKYTGIEYDFIIVEELNQLTEEKYKKLRGSLRTSKPNWRPRMYTSFNPGGIGHTFVKNRYVIPSREENEGETRFIGGTYRMNPYLNPEYLQYLEGLDGNLGKAWREGDFDIFEGMYFTEWNRPKHVVAPFPIPVTWFKFRSIDPSGREGVTSCHWYAVDSNGRVYCYREYYKTGRDYDEHAKAIYAMSCDKDGIPEDCRYTVIDAAAFSKAGYSETAAEIYERNGVTGLISAAKERLIGWNGVHTYLRWDEKISPQLQIFSTCVNLIRTLPLAQHDELHPEDVASISTSFTDSDGRTGTEHQDALDELRYFLRTLRETHAPKPLNPVERKLQAFRDRNSGQSFDYSYTRR